MGVRAPARRCRWTVRPGRRPGILHDGREVARARPRAPPARPFRPPVLALSAARARLMCILGAGSRQEAPWPALRAPLTTRCAARGTVLPSAARAARLFTVSRRNAHHEIIDAMNDATRTSRAARAPPAPLPSARARLMCILGAGSRQAPCTTLIRRPRQARRGGLRALVDHPMCSQTDKASGERREPRACSPSAGEMHTTRSSTR